jgi:hypothetical protein
VWQPPLKDPKDPRLGYVSSIVEAVCHFVVFYCLRLKQIFFGLDWFDEIFDETWYSSYPVLQGEYSS